MYMYHIFIIIRSRFLKQTITYTYIYIYIYIRGAFNKFKDYFDTDI